jgi:2-phosphosulfolactate phosphatase
LRILVHSGRVGAEWGAREGLVTVVVDALRASATIASFLEFGATEVMVVEHVEQALAEKRRRPEVVLVGERECRRVEGCDYGNSPLRRICPGLPGPVVFTSSNCSRCCVAAAGRPHPPAPSPCGRGGEKNTTPTTTGRHIKCRPYPSAPRLFLGTTVNATAVARAVGEAARKLGTDVLLVPAGTAEDETKFNLDDHLACGALIRKLQQQLPTARVANDAARAAQALFGRVGEKALAQAFLRTDHGRRLVEVGCEEDVRWAARVDVYQAAPVFRETRELGDGGVGVVFVTE